LPPCTHMVENYRNYTDDELQEANLLLLQDIASIKYQLETAKSDAMTEGDYADPAWFRKANYALRMKGINQQALTAEMGRRRRLTQSTLETWFVRIAREILEEDLFDEIMDEAKDKVRSQTTEV
jgi:hypothetical protein